MARRFIIANWKMNPTNKEEASALAAEVESQLPESQADREVIVCPPFIYLQSVRSVLNKSKLGSQDISCFEGGAYTGEVSGRQLYNMGVGYCIIGHSERRQFIHETSEEIRAKLRTCLDNKMIPVLCVGGGLKASDDEATIRAMVRKQFNEGLDNSPIDVLLVTYEPTWAIGSGRTPDPDHVSRIAAFLREQQDELHVKEMYILYGGSVNSHNASSFRDIDGFLVGGASLDGHEFAEIVRAFK